MLALLNSTHAIFYIGGKMRDLNDLLAQKSDRIVTRATGINDAGQIARHRYI